MFRLRRLYYPAGTREFPAEIGHGEAIEGILESQPAWNRTHEAGRGYS